MTERGRRWSFLAPRPDEKRRSKPATVDDDAKRNRAEQSVETEIGFLDHDPAGDHCRDHPRETRQQRRRRPSRSLACEVEADAKTEQAIERRDVTDVGYAGCGDLIVGG